jgi:hypothetical protein
MFQLAMFKKSTLKLTLLTSTSTYTDYLHIFKYIIVLFRYRLAMGVLVCIVALTVDNHYSFFKQLTSHSDNH